MSRAISNRLAKLEALNLNVTTGLVVRRHGEDVALFSRTIRYQDPAEIQLRWPERKEAVESHKDHAMPEVETDMVQHGYSEGAVSPKPDRK